MQLPTDLITVQSLSTYAGMLGAMLAVAAGLFLMGADDEVRNTWIMVLSVAASLYLALIPGNTNGAVILVAAFNGVLVGVGTIIAFFAIKPTLVKYQAKREAKKQEQTAQTEAKNQETQDPPV